MKTTTKQRSTEAADALVMAYHHTRALSPEKRNVFFNALWEGAFASVPVADVVLDLLIQGEKNDHA